MTWPQTTAGNVEDPGDDALVLDYDYVSPPLKPVRCVKVRYRYVGRLESVPYDFEDGDADNDSE